MNSHQALEQIQKAEKEAQAIIKKAEKASHEAIAQARIKTEDIAEAAKKRVRCDAITLQQQIIFQAEKDAQKIRAEAIQAVKELFKKTSSKHPQALKTLLVEINKKWQ